MKFKEKTFFLIFILFSIIITLTLLIQENPDDVLPEKTKYDQDPASTNHTKEDKEPPKEANVLENAQKSQSPIKPIETRPTNDSTFTITHVPTATMDNSSTINVHINASPTNNDVSIATIDDSKNVVKIATIDDSKNVTIATIDSSKDSKDSSGAVAPVDDSKNTNNSSEASAGIDSPKDTNNSSAEIADVDSSNNTKNSSAENDDDDNISREL